MTERTEEAGDATRGDESAPGGDPTRDNQENELAAEQESAAAMDTETPQPPGANETTEGQPS